MHAEPEAPAQLEHLHIHAASAVEAHAELGKRLGPAIRAVVARRSADTPALELDAQLRTARGVARHLREKAADPALPEVLRVAVRDYLACLAAWAEAAELGQVLPAPVDGVALDAFHVALWLQDDNTGCQTGLVRRADGSVLLFHTEEDTIGYFDRPRIVHMLVGGVLRSAFLYPYLLPGPAFGWHADGLFAYDTLQLLRTSAGGTPTSTLSFILWWARGALPAYDTARQLAPFLDGGALAIVTRGPDGVLAEQIEVGGEHVVRTALGPEAGARHVQVNTLSEGAAPLVPLELYDAAGRAPYIARLARAHRELARLGAGLTAHDVLAMLASTEGGSWGFANDDVVAHFVAVLAPHELALVVGEGQARAGVPPAFTCWAP